jgi:hypothetical protein
MPKMRTGRMRKIAGIMKTLQDLWREYRDKCYPNSIPADQNRETHQAFFAGAFTMFVEMSAASELKAPDDIKRTKALSDEAMAVCAARAMNLKAQN